MVAQGILIKLNKKYYQNANFDGEESDFYYAYAFVPDGVVCLLSAAVYYNLSTYRPDAIDIAIQRKARISTLPDWPELNVCYFTDERFKVGIETVEDGNNKFRIYDIEKTVVDIVFYREKIGIEEMKEVLTTYLHRSDRNLNRLIRYADLLKCGSVMKQYLEVLV
jgi:predicted transcriptional regulator of viral defense system